MFRDRFSRMNKFRKRAFAVALATAVASTSFNIGSIAVNAGTSARGRVIVAFEELPEDVAEQTLPIGGKKSDINLPEELDVLLYSEDAEKEDRKKETVSKDRTDDAAETPTESPADEKQSEGATEAASEESQDSNTDTANTDTGSANDGSAVTPDSSRDGDTASEPTNETGTDGDNTDSQPAEGRDGTGETGEDTDDTIGRLTDRVLTAVGSAFVPVKAYAAEPATEESEEAESGVETQGDGAADTVLAAQPSANSASDTDADEAADKGGKKTDEEPSEEPETEAATEAASESPAGSSEKTATDSSDESNEGVSRLSDGERRTLEDVRWKLVRDKSEYGSRFQAIREGDVFYFAPDIKAYGLKSDVDLPEIRVTIVAAEDETASGNDISGNAISGNGVSENSISGKTVSENSYPEFDQFMIVSGVKVSVTAPEGVFPEDAILKVKRIDDVASNEKIEQAVKEDMGLSDAAEVNGVRPDGADSEAGDPDGSSASAGEALSYISFDITITDVSGNEIQPNTEYGKANVTFSQVDIISDYLSAPGEETEGKLADVTKADSKNDLAEDTLTSTSYVNEEGQKVYVLSGDGTGVEDVTGSGVRKTLRVYHADEELDNMEKLLVSLDESDSAAMINTDHFSPFTVAIGTNTSSSEGDFGDFHVQVTGAQLEVTVDGATATDPAITTVSITVIPSAASQPDIKVSLKGKDSTSQKLKLQGGIDDNPSNITLDRIKMTTGSQILVNSFKAINLVLSDVNIKSNTNVGLLDIRNTTGKLRFHGISIEGPTPFLFEESTMDCFVGEGTNKFNANSSSSTKSNINEKTTLNFYGEEESNGILEIESDSFPIFQGYHGKNTINFESGNYVFNSKNSRFAEGATTGTDEINIKGGRITATSIAMAPSSSTNRVNMSISGGTLNVCPNFIGKPLDNEETIQNDYLKITGGSIHVTDEERKTIADSQGTIYLHAVVLRDTAYNPVKGILIRKLYDGNNSGLSDYGLNDTYTDSVGKVYLWRKSEDYKVYSLSTDDGTRYVWDKTEPADESNNDVKYKYAEKEKTSTFIPYDYITDIEFDYSKLLIGDNYFKDLLTFKTKNGKTYTGSEVIGANVEGLYDRLRDIDWSLKPMGTVDARIIGNLYDVGVNKPNVKSVTLTATIDNTKVGGEKKEWTFYIPKYIPVETISLAKEVTMMTGEEYMLDGTNALGTTATVEPENATFSDIVWSVKDPAGNALTLTDKKFKPTVVGDYTVTATVANGKTETTPYTQDFKVACKKEIKENMVTVSPTDNPYTGKEVKPSVIIEDDDGTVLTEGTDYTVEYKNNINKTTNTSKAKVIIKGKGSYTTADEGLSKEFNIADLPTGTITVADPALAYSAFQTEDKVAVYVKNAASITITGKGSDGTTDLANDKIKYYISDTYYGTTAELNAAVTAWTDYAAFTTRQDQKNYIYAKLTDGTDAYISTQCIIDDRTPPDKPVISSGTVAGTTGTVTIYANDTLSGIADYYVMAVKKGATAPTADQVKANGVNSSASPVKIGGLSSAQEYTFYAVVEDKAGNYSVISDGKDSVVGAGKISGTIKVMGYTYSKLQGKQETEDYTNEQKEIKITATAENGVKSIEYFITDKFYSSTSAIEGAAKETKGSGNAAFTVSNWATYNDSARPYLLKNKLNYIYVKITDNGGYTEYISSKGIWEDEINPTTSSTSSTPKDTTAASTVKGTDKESGVKNYYLLVRKATDSAPSKAEDVKSAGMKSEDGKFNVTGLTAATKYTVYAVTEDKAGNLSEIKKSSFTTKKASTTAEDAAKKAAAASAAAAAAAGGGSGSGSKTGNGSNVAKRTAGAGAGGSDSVSDNGDGDSADSDIIRDGVPYIEDATDGILIGRENTSGWERIESEAGKASQPSQIHVDMNGSTVVPAAALRQCRDRDITYYFRLNDDITWTVNGLSFTADPGDIDFRVRTDTRNIPSKLVNEVADVYPHTNLTIEHDGDFGFTAILSVNMGSDNEGMYANLYYYDEGNNALNFMDSTEVDGGGRASFEFLHASDYTVILRGDALTDKSAAALTDDNFMSTDNTSATSSGPVNVSRNTGSLWLIVVSVISFLLCGLILFMPDKRNRRRGPANAVS